MTTASRAKWQEYGLYLIMILLTLYISGSGIEKLIGSEKWVNLFTRFGYPLWFMYLTGIGEIISGVLLWIPRTRSVGAAGFAAIMAGAAVSNLLAGIYLFAAITLAFALFFAWLAWQSRSSWLLSD